MPCSLGFPAQGHDRSNWEGKFMKKSAAVLAGVVMAMGMAAPAFADSDAAGSAASSPGVLSGNVVQLPLDLPTNLCGNSLGIVSLLNPAFGTACGIG
jgi:hypothetical protein